MARQYRKSEAQWRKQYAEYLAQWGRSIGRVYKFDKVKNLYDIDEITGDVLTYEQFKVQYTIARQTNIQLTGKVGDVYKTIIEKGPEESRVFRGRQVQSKAQAKRLQKILNEQEKSKPVKERHYYTIKELQATGGAYASAMNEELKAQGYDSYQRAEMIGEELYGSP